MTTEAELLAAVCAAPDDDAPRLVYADWLQERGDPRGDFITMQCRPRLFEADVFQRAWQLELAHREAWLAPITALLAHSPPLHFARGFVERIVVSEAEWLDHGEALCALTPLVEVELLQVRSLAAILGAPGTCGLRSLLARRGVTKVGNLAHVPALPQLRSLALTDVVRSAGLSRLAELRGVAPLDLFLDHASLDAEALDAVLRGLGARLRRITLDENPLDGTVARVLAAHTELSTVSLARIDLGGAVDALVAELPQSIRELDLGSCRIGDEGAAVLATQQRLELASLTLTGNRIGARALSVLRKRYGAALII